MVAFAMSRDGPRARISHIRSDGDGDHRIPERAGLSWGEFGLRSLQCGHGATDEDAAAAWIAEFEVVSEDLLYRVRDGIRRFTDELGVAWRGQLASAGVSAVQSGNEAAGVELSHQHSGEVRMAVLTGRSAAERAETSAQVLNAAATRVAEALELLTEQLEVASRRGSQNEDGAISSQVPVCRIRGDRACTPQNHSDRSLPTRRGDEDGHSGGRFDAIAAAAAASNGSKSH